MIRYVAISKFLIFYIGFTNNLSEIYVNPLTFNITLLPIDCITQAI